MNSGKVAKYSVGIAIIVCAGKILGFLKQGVIAWAFGANSMTDIYFAADGCVSTVAQIMGMAIAPTVLTSYLTIKNQHGDLRANRLISKSLALFFIIALSTVIALFISAERLAVVVGLSFDSEQQYLLAEFIRELSPCVVIFSLSGVFQGYFNATNRFWIAKLATFFYSAFIVLAVVLFKDRIGIKSMIYGFLFGGLIYLGALALYGRKVVIWGIGYKGNNSDLLQTVKSFLPLLISVAIVDAGHLIDKIIASSLEPGSISILNYGQVVSGDLVNAIVISTVGTVLLSKFTDEVAMGVDSEIIIDDVKTALRVVCVLIFLIMALYCVEGEDLIIVLLKRGKFSGENVKEVLGVAKYYVMGFVFMAVREIIMKIHYAYRDMLSPMINCTVGMLVNVGLSILLSCKMGVVGIAIATSVSLLVITAMSMITLRKHIGLHILNTGTLKEIFKMIISMLVAIMSGWVLHRWMITMFLIGRLMVTSLAMLFLFLATAGLLREKAVIEVISVIGIKWKRYNSIRQGRE